MGVVGSGPAGRRLADLLAASGRRVVVLGRDFTADQLGGCGLVIEAVPEQAKQSVLDALDRLCCETTVLATTAVPVRVSPPRPDRFLAVQFCGPAARTGLLEINAPAGGHPALTAVADAFAADLSRAGLKVRSGTGCAEAANAVAVAMLRDAAAMVADGYVTAEDLDAAMRAGAGMAVGPMRLMAEMGLGPGSAGSRGSVPLGTPHPVRKVAVVGTGTMARGIAEVFVSAGFDTLVVGRSAERLAGDAFAVSTDYTTLADRDLVVEAVVEDLAVKREVMALIDLECRPGAVLATTTSSLPVVEIALATSRPHDVVGLHFFNPAPVMELVEVVRTSHTGADVLATALRVCADLGKSPVVCGDRAGFIVNRLLFPCLNATLALLDGLNPGDLDTAVRAALGLPLGPLRLLDVVGTDVALEIQRSLRQATGDAPAPMLERLVADGVLGSKNGRTVRKALAGARA
ncbi:3-hydroxyacyl-CoA dehydrogenase NAD-binding domain-containing protein [Lentzea aerocolonigenes]|uniref:3-hydroxyacyl-CoA dehydrogenase NAD-binding domain-containing protein n=1 Tax=Lentzea aerocolonigenes TaxID=68170 RepID=UPI00069886CA|nr:3-hydroxyacyl-CoA dehydrogenase NAD-binding domain-containing protein [Lentzea aerocolonigenes]